MLLPGTSSYEHKYDYKTILLNDRVQLVGGATCSSDSLL